MNPALALRPLTAFPFWVVRMHLLCPFIGVAMLVGFSANVRGQQVDFQSDVLPILSDRCFVCHGPDEATREAGLRLDQQEDLLAKLVPGASADSELWQRVNAEDESMIMPPPESHLELSEAEKAVLRDWIDDGAQWDGHWSLRRLAATVPVPEVGGTNSALPLHPIDAFVQARLAENGLQPNRPAPRWRWLRRVTLDLTGLPPTPAEIEAFLNDDSDTAFEAVVDRLLASPHFGEHMAISWLDAARYADSYGYQSDRLSPTWPWRDWVVRALNANLPYDQFLRWQIAGDLMPESDREQVLATAFNRLHRMTNEGGSIELEWRTEYVADRVNTLGTAVLGLTLECARCHDHKFDPISQRDYYNLSAYFNSIDEYGMYNDSEHVPTPTLLLPTEEQADRIAAAERTLRSAQRAVDDYADSFINSFKEASQAVAPDDQAEPVARFPLDEIGESNELVNTIEAERPGSSGAGNHPVAGKFGEALALSGDDPLSLNNLELRLDPWVPFTVAFWVYLPAELDDAVLLHHSAGTDVGFYGTDLQFIDDRLRFTMARFWPGNALSVVTRESIPRDEWVFVAIGNEANGSATGLRIRVNDGKDCDIVRDNLSKAPGQPGSGFTIGERFRSPGLKDGKVDEVLVYDRWLSQVELDGLLGKGVSAESTDDVRLADQIEHALFHDSRYQELVMTRAQACQAVLAAQTSVLEVPVMRETERPHPAWVLARGDYDAPRTEANLAERATPEALPRDDDVKDRLELADWLTSPDHPLTARVAVNRLWFNFFGRGLVRTMNDFGLQGERPTHPELLDWLARDFIDGGWDVKQFCREVVLSQTYRQDSAVSSDRWAQDPDNTWLARGPARRLTAEMIRDLALSASGLLNREMGGPPVSPYQPPNLWREDNTMTPAYQQSVGEALYRRSLYTVWKRTAPIPNMLVFDAPGREVCTMQRTETNTPLQALVLLNDPQFVEAARVTAERVLREVREADGDGRGPTERAFVRLVGRSPDEREAHLLDELFESQFVLFGEDPTEAEKLLTIGEHPRDDTLDTAETAAFTVVVQAILASDAAIWRR